ncbi:MAG: hypothetical protein K8R59_06520, partial [Thermoanaerobaculales bacterium]|nr:hypothetical protein [Thermoanaerobaculales bacterium]
AVLKRLETPRKLWALVVFGVMTLVLLTVPHGECAGTYQQSFVLKPGWNAVFLEVTPENRSVESAFAGIPIASVWTWMPSDETVQFIQDPNENQDLTSGWLGYFPRPRPEAFLTNLFILQANRAYLIKLDGTQSVTWNVTGVPSLRSMRWVPDSFNLVGFHVDPGRRPTFGSYFADRAALEGQPIYRLGEGGVWTLVEQPYSNTITPGAAYWVYCDGKTDFDGPMEVSVEWGDRMDFSSSLSSQVLVVRNRTVVDVDITLRQLTSQTPAPLSMKIQEEDTGRETWASLPSTYAVPAPAGRELLLKFGVRRAEFTADEVGGILEVTNGLGARRLVPIDAKRYHAPPADQSKAAKAGGIANFAGLWQATVLVNGVSEAQMGGTTPEDTGKLFPLRILIHVDSAGVARLVNEVVEMWEEGTMAPDPENPGFLITETPGRAVLLTNEDLIPNFTGVTMRDGVPVGIRLSSIAYDFPGEVLEMDGAVGPTGTLEATLVMDADFATNPYKHGFHPDHNNLDEQFLNPRQEAYEVTRSIQFVFSDIDPREDNDPEWGDSLLGGTYFEEISGLHRNTIFVGGTFRLRRVAGVPELNQ